MLIPDPSGFLLQSLSAAQSLGSNSFELWMLLPQIFKIWNKQRYAWISWIEAGLNEAVVIVNALRVHADQTSCEKSDSFIWQIICRCLSTRNKYLQCGVPAQVHPVGSASACGFCLLPDSLLNTESHKWHVQRVVEDSELFRGLYQALCFPPSLFLTDFNFVALGPLQACLHSTHMSEKMKHLHKSNLVPDGATQMSPMASISSSCITHQSQNIACPTCSRLWSALRDWLQFGALAFWFWLGPLTKRQMRTFKNHLRTISSKHVPHTGRHSDSNDEERRPCLSPKVWNRDNLWSLSQ